MNFIFPNFLYALSAIAIPIIIHLIELRRAKRVLFTNLSFIKEVKNVTASNRRLKQLLILFCRIFFILFLVLLFCQPYFPKENSNGSINNRNKIFIDNSMSMQSEAVENNTSLLQVAIDQARDIVGLLNSNSTYQLATNSKLSYVNYSASDIVKQVDLIRESANNRSFNSVASWFTNSDNMAFNGFLLSDFQKSNFNAGDLLRLDSTNQFYLIPLNSVRKENLFIDTVYSEDVFIRANENNQLQARIKNTGSEEVKNCQVKFFIGDKQVSALSLTVPPNKAIPFSLTYRLSNNTASDCKIVIEDFPVTFDNTFYFTLRPSRSIKILEVGKNNLFGDKLFTNENVFQYTSSAPDNINYKLIDEADLLILNGLEEVDASLAENVGAFVKAGGDLIVIPSANMNRSSYQNLFSKLQLQNINLPAKPDTIKTLVASPNVDNPFFENIFSEQSRNRIMPKASRIWQWSRSSNDILTFKGGGNFLSSFRISNGSTYLFSSPFTETYSDFQNHAIFVPVMYKLAMLSSRQQQPLAYSLSSRIINLPFKQSLQPEQIIKLRKDTIEFIPEQQIRKNQLVLGIPPEVNEGGFYDILQNDSRISRIAFNFDKKESDINQYTVDELRTILKSRKNIQVLDPADELEIKKELNNEQLGIPLWKYCLILCLIFMLTEILLIRYL